MVTKKASTAPELTATVLAAPMYLIAGAIPGGIIIARLSYLVIQGLVKIVFWATKKVTEIAKNPRW